MYVQETGPAAAPTIVFLHGGGLSSRMWEPQIERMADYHCLAPDLPEHGRSADGQAFDMDDATRQVAGLIRERAHGQRAHVVGLSLGGAVTLTLLRLAPECVDHAIVSGTAARLGKLLGTVGIASAYLLRFMSREWLADATFKQQGIPAQYRDLFYDDLLKTSTVQFNLHIIRSIMNMELPPRNVGIRLLAAVGEKETGPAKQAARQIVASIDGAHGVMVPGFGHVWNLQAPDLFVETVRAWISDMPLPALLRPLTP